MTMTTVATKTSRRFLVFRFDPPPAAGGATRV
jgi:hypothetical protein